MKKTCEEKERDCEKLMKECEEKLAITNGQIEETDFLREEKKKYEQIDARPKETNKYNQKTTQNR